jgi:uncharacterized alkaline shock family protein YloU
MPTATATPSAPPAPATTPKSAGPDQDGRGTTTIADSVVTKVAGIAAREVGGVYALGGSGARAIGNVTQKVGIDNRSQGVSVDVDDREAKIDLTVVLEYGESIPNVTEEIRGQVVRRVEAICGLTVTTVDISVADLHFAGDDDESDGQA